MSESENDPFADYRGRDRAVEDAPSRGAETPRFGRGVAGESAEAPLRRAWRGGIRRVVPLGIAAAAAIAVGLSSSSGARTCRAVPPPMADVTITSPGDRIEDTRPSVRWTSRHEPGQRAARLPHPVGLTGGPRQRYDVWILPEAGDYLEASTLFVARGVTSPLPSTGSSRGRLRHRLYFSQGVRP